MAKGFRDIFEDLRTALGFDRAKPEDDPALDTTDAPKGLGSKTLAATTERFNEALPYIERAGYEVTEIEVGLGLSPRLNAHLHLDRHISDEEKEALLQEVAKRRLIHTILSTLFRASAARKKLKFRHFHFAQLELELSILPTVVLKFLPNTPEEIEEGVIYAPAPVDEKKDQRQ